MKKISVLLLMCFLFFSTLESTAQAYNKDKKEKKEKEEKEEKKEKEEKNDRMDRDTDKKDKEWEIDKDDADKDKKEKKRDQELSNKDDNDYRENRDQRKNRRSGGILGKVIGPRNGGPRELSGVPNGHYPPPGSCRVWYPNKPPGHQPPPTSCNSLIGIRLEPGAFILHGDKAYDSEYDWREEERRRPGSIGRDILDILFPPKR